MWGRSDVDPIRLEIAATFTLPLSTRTSIACLTMQRRDRRNCDRLAVLDTNVLKLRQERRGMKGVGDHA